MDNMSQVLLNPIRMRVVQYLAAHETVTAGELGSLVPDIPRTTLYRHLKILVNANVLSVVSENRVRGTVEKVYSLNRTAISSRNTLENATLNAFSFLMTIYADFDRYFADPNCDPGKDRLFMNKVVLLMSDEEYDTFLGELAKLMAKHLQQEPSVERKPRNFSVISSPNIE